VSFRSADLRDSFFWRAELIDANFGGANLQHADFRSAVLCGADFTQCRLAEASFTFAQLARACFESPDVPGLSARDLTWEQLQDANGVEQALLPGYLQPREAQPGQAARAPDVDLGEAETGNQVV